MSRWGKSRHQSFALPLDALVKEKENTNRPIAARSAGTVGKWGITSFTSIRAHAIYGYDSYQEPPQYPNSVSHSLNDGQSNQLPQTAGHLTDVTPKPKKFFKSRNSVPETDSTAISSSISPNSSVGNITDNKQTPTSGAANKIGIKIKKEARKNEDKQKQKPEKQAKVSKKKAKTDEKSLSNKQPKPTRVLSRTRKAINYSEDKSRSPSPVRVNQTNPVQSTNLTSSEPAITDEIATNFGDASPNKNATAEHPPIVLRISKGTSRLVSTDSEGIANSPPYLSPIQQSQVITTNYQAAAASLISVLSDDPVEQPPEPNNLDTAPKSKPKPKKPIEENREKAEPIKIRIKTKLSKNKLELENFDTDLNKKPTRASRQQQKDQQSTNDYQQTANDTIEQTVSQSYGYAAHETTSDYQQYENQKSIEVEQLSMKPDTAGDANLNTEIKQSPRRATRNKAQAKEIATKLVETQRETKESTAKNKREKRNQKRTAEDEPKHLVEQSSKKDAEHVIDSTQAAEPLEKKTDEKEVLMVSPKKRRVLERNISDSPPPAVQTRTRRGKPAATVTQATEPIPNPAPAIDRKTRSKRAEEKMQEKDTQPEIPLVTRSYSRKRKIKSPEHNVIVPMQVSQSSTDDAKLLLTVSEQLETRETVNINIPLIDPDLNDKYEPKLHRTRAKLQAQYNSSEDNLVSNSNNHNQLSSSSLTTNVQAADNNEEKPSVKLVISKKKGSIFKSRAVNIDSGDNTKQKRHVYKHKWDDDLNEDKTSTTELKNLAASDDPYADEFTQSGSGKSSSLNTPASSTLSKFTTDDDLRVRNVKKAHQMQEIGEFQEMDDDVEYILESLKNHNPIATRSLAAVQLASKCMTPAFRMHVRAHGTATKFFSALYDATQNRCLGLCTATIMFVLIQDNLNMDLDKHSLELMLNLLDSDLSQKQNSKDSGLTDEQLQRIESKVYEICREIKSQGKASYLKLDNISIGTLAMETLLTLTSKRAGEWFKDELRSLGGLEHIIDTICECCKQITDYVVDWTDVLLEKLRKIERCLRVLENVSERNEDNQKYILYYKDGHMVETLVKFYKLCDTEISLYPTTEQTPPENPGTVLREALVPTLKVLINLTHTFNNKPLGCSIFGEKPIIFSTSFHLLFQATHYVPEKCVFELSLLVLLLLNNLIAFSIPNRANVMEVIAPSDFGNQFVKVPAIKALIEYFYKYEEMARFVEKNTDAMLDDPNKSEKAKYKSQEEIEETVSTLIQKAGNHMEHTMLASYVCLLIGHLVIENKDHELTIRKYLRNGKFDEMVQILEKYYNFMNLTASSEATQVAHIKETKKIIQYLNDSDLQGQRSEDTSNISQWQLDKRQNEQRGAQQYSQSYKTYSSSISTPLTSSTSSINAAAASSSTDGSINNNNAFNKLFHHSGR